MRRRRRCVDSIPIPRNSKSEGSKYDVDALDALEIPRLGIELHFGWGLSYLSPKLTAQSGGDDTKPRTVRLLQ
jgi:hypothetical protein